MNRNWSYFCIFQTAKKLGIWFETFSSNLDELIFWIKRSTLWEWTINIIETEYKTIICVIYPIKSEVYLYLISSCPAGRWSTLHSLFINEVSRNISHRRSLISPTFFWISLNLSKSTFNSFKAAGNIWKLFSFQKNFGTTFNTSWLWNDWRNYWFLVIVKWETWFNKILAIQRNSYRLRS